MQTELPIIAVLLTCHNRKEKTLRCLKQLYAQEAIGIKYSIHFYLVDDGSTDNTADAISFQYPEVVIIKGNGNLYWSRGMRLAWETAAQKENYDFYLWVNDDVSVFPEALLHMLESYYISKPKALICGATKSEITNKYTYGGLTPDGKKIIPNGYLQPCTIMNGNFVLVSQPIFKEVGFIDSIFPHSIGDHDYGLRAIKKGFRILMVPEYIGFCEEHEQLPEWCLPEIPFLKRIRSLYSPLGCQPYYYFIYEKRHFGLFTAIKHFFSIHLRVLIPSLWK